MQRSSRTVLISLLVVGSLTVVGIGASVASAQSRTHTLQFRSIQLTSHNLAHDRFINTDKDRSHGKYFGNDVFEGTLNPTTLRVSTIDSFALKGGFIYGKTRTVGENKAEGNVTGGTGTYKGIKGTIVVGGTSQDSPVVTIKYHG
jgi:hypothetical protein